MDKSLYTTRKTAPCLTGHWSRITLHDLESIPRMKSNNQIITKRYLSKNNIQITVCEDKERHENNATKKLVSVLVADTRLISQEFKKVTY